MPVADTSWILGLFDADDPHHHDAHLEAATADPIIVPGPVLAEFLQVIFFRVQRQSSSSHAHAVARGFLQQLVALPTVDVQPDYDGRAVSALYLATPTLSYPDAVGIVAAAGQGLMSFDKVQKRIHASRAGK